MDSLAETVLQNRRGLALLLLQQGGLCTALGENSCFYANNSGKIVKKQQQKTKLEQSKNWFQRLFNWSPWLTTLLSAAIGPLTLLLLALIMGPCLINCFANFIQQRMNSVKLMVLRSHYDPLPNNNLEESTILLLYVKPVGNEQ
ncbi:hypothetical protein QTO34_013123 [Cnephaeus nilssonii]|uniref:ENV1 protein n=1 Tax=Cnephaeus nilssonii TaxID=3371016 RepID=A0AA40LUV2_CNENI|nr:hypothetical protein QTO34_013123 [Eptesicus nilssonii]